ncbi:MAG: DUF359 domain-containing protein [Archaeoglobi archaeon]|nr:DUF359 domain-containing protein [Archaeoglobi archaeon]
MLRVTEKLREELSVPFGRLYEGRGPELVKRIEEIRQAKLLATIGDLVSLFTFQAGFEPDIVVIDFKTERRELGDSFESDIMAFLRDYRIVRVENPQGHVTEELVRALREGISAGRTCVIVDGEEDMSALPLALLLPEGSVILYGIPSRGIAAYTVDEEGKVLISRMVEEMEEVGDDRVRDMLIGGEVNGAAD